MNKKTKILTVMVIFAIAIIPLVSAEQLFQLGNAEKTYDYHGTVITCYLGQLFPGQPIYWCMYPDGSMNHSWFVYQQNEMNDYYVTGGITTTFTVRP